MDKESKKNFIIITLGMIGMLICLAMIIVVIPYNEAQEKADDNAHGCYGIYEYVESKDACCNWNYHPECTLQNPDGSCAYVDHGIKWKCQ